LRGYFSIEQASKNGIRESLEKELKLDAPSQFVMARQLDRGVIVVSARIAPSGKREINCSIEVIVSHGKIKDMEMKNIEGIARDDLVKALQAEPSLRGKVTLISISGL
jgi:hypothetical protein